MTLRVLLLLCLFPQLAFAQLGVGGLRRVGSGASSGNINTNSSFATQSAQTYYVDPTGSDSNACTAAGTSACLTCGGVISKLPLLIKNPVQVNFAAGTYATGCVLDTTLYRSVADNGGSLTLTGTYGLTTLTTGLNSGTIVSATPGSAATTTFGTFSVTSATWTTDDLKGKLVVATNGSTTQVRAIKSNTNADPGVATIAGEWTTNPTGGTWTFQIVESTTIFNTVASGVTGSAYAMYIENQVGGDNTLSTGAKNVVTIERMRFTTAVGAIQVVAPARVRIQGNEFRATTTNVNVIGGGAGVALVQDNVFGPNNGTGLLVGSTGLAVHQRNVHNADRTGLFATNSQANGGMSEVGSFSNYYYNNLDFGIRVGSGSLSASGEIMERSSAGSTTAIDCGDTSIGTCKIASSSISTWGTAIKGNGPFGKTITVSSVVGTANTTAMSFNFGNHVQITSGTTLTGATEISIEGTPYTLAQLRAPAAGLRAISELGGRGTRVFE